eukprot:1239895-Prymnesium_polylepis.1
MPGVGGAQGRGDTVRRARALQTTLNGGDSHATCLLYSKDVNTRYVPRGGVPFRNVTSTRWRT